MGRARTNPIQSQHTEPGRPVIEQAVYRRNTRQPTSHAEYFESLRRQCGALCKAGSPSPNFARGSAWLVMPLPRYPPWPPQPRNRYPPHDDRKLLPGWPSTANGRARFRTTEPIRTRTRLGCGLGIGLSYTMAAFTSFDVTTTVLMVVIVVCYLNAADVARLSGAWQI